MQDLKFYVGDYSSRVLGCDAVWVPYHITPTHRNPQGYNLHGDSV
jgi:hypothetical protein